MARSHLQPRKTRIYSNNSVYSPSGLLMFRCSTQKLEWYIKRGLGEEMEGAELLKRLGVPPGTRAVRLLFEPRGKGRNRVGDEWYLEDQREICVVCGYEGRIHEEVNPANDDDDDDDDEQTNDVNDGNDNTHKSNDEQKNNDDNDDDDDDDDDLEEKLGEEDEEEGLTLHHVVPYQYRREMPLSFKSHGSHDVLVLCVRCHADYEHYADEEKASLVRMYEAPLAGRGWIKYPAHGPVRASAGALLRYRQQIPARRVAELEAQVCDFYGLSRGSEDITETVLRRALELKTIEKGAGFKEHGTLVIEGIEKRYGEAGFADFVRFWRQHFLDTLKPRFLSKKWQVDDPVNLVAGEYNPYRPEMDGS